MQIHAGIVRVKPDATLSHPIEIDSGLALDTVDKLKAALASGSPAAKKSGSEYE